MAVPLPPLELSSVAASSASGYQSPIQFGSYTASPIVSSGNDPIVRGSIGSVLPAWVWPVAIVGAFLLAKKGSK